MDREGSLNPSDETSCDLDPREELETRESEIDPASDRIRRLREENVEKEPEISAERGRLVTEFYRSEAAEDLSEPVRRARSFEHLMKNVSLPVEDGQLLVGLRGTGVKEVPSYPEISRHSSDDLEMLDTREKNPYHVDDETRRELEEEVYPHWEGTAMRDRIFEEMTEEWMDAYEAGVFTEFMEQRAPGHTAGGERIFETGLNEITGQIDLKIDDLEAADDENRERIEELKGMKIAADAIVTYARRYAEKLETLAAETDDAERQSELEEMARICRKVPAEAPDTFWEALQHYWFVHVGVVTETNPWDSFNPGRLDQHLVRFYERETETGDLSRQEAKELLQAFWLKINAHPSPPKVGVTAQESNTYNDFTKINIGGLQPDGSSGVNDVSYLLLEVLQEMRTLQPNTAVLTSKRISDRFFEEALDVVRPGFGEPPFFNHDEIVKNQLRQGKSLEDARKAGVSGCVESGVFGKESYILTGYFNLPKVLEITLHNGNDPRTGKRIGRETGDPAEFEDYEDLFAAFTDQLEYFLDVKMAGNDRIEELYAEHLPVPFLSLWMDDCVEDAADYNEGGTRYNTQYVQIVGLGTIADSLSALKDAVFEEGRYDLEPVIDALHSDFEGDEAMQQFFTNRTPKYGNDDDFADGLAVDVFDACIEQVESYPATPVREASRHVFGLPTTAHVYFGSVCEATPDGRGAGQPLSEGISPVQGADEAGPAAVFRSVGKLDHVKAGGTLLNQKLSPDLVQDDEVLPKLAQLMRGYFKMDTHHVQYNVVSADLLRKAQDNPEEFDNLMVRVAGYSDYFVNLPEGLQEEIINRTEHDGF